MTKNIYFNTDTWELFERLRQNIGVSRGEFIHRLLMAYITVSFAEGANNAHQ